MRPIPDSPLVREASTLARTTLSAPVLQHSTRAFLLGRAYAEARRVAFDEEGLLLAALFHDFGLSDALRDGARAFTEVSAAELRSFLEDRGEGPRGAALGEAIELHMQLLPRWRSGPEAGLLQIGAWMDVTRLRAWSVGRRFIREVERLHPRSGFDLEFHARLLRSLRSFRSCHRLLFPRSRRPTTP